MNRSILRKKFLSEQHLSTAKITPLVPDASARCYFRIAHDGKSMMLMDAPPNAESCSQFIRVTEYLTMLGARAPKIMAKDETQGFILLEDLGNHTMTWLLNNGSDEAALYHKAIDRLITIQQKFSMHQSSINLPPYDLSATLAETALFTDWYLPARLERKLKSQEKSDFIDLWTELYNTLPLHDPVLVHRDFHVDNLLMVDNECAMLDYQDALIGSPVYDLMSLVEDARRDINPSLKAAIIERWQNSIMFDTAIFEQHYAFWAAQRHCKVAGIFVRLWLRDDKSQYLKHLPRVMELLEQHLHQPMMQLLSDWIKKLLPETAHKSLSTDANRLRSYIDLEIN